MDPVIDRDRLFRYLLGQLPEPEQEQLEQQYFADGDCFAQVASAEDDLIDLYVMGQLAPRDRARFESHFLAGNAERRHKVAFARSLRKYVTAQAPRPQPEPWWKTLLGPLTLPRLAFAGMAAGVVLIALFTMRPQPHQPSPVKEVAQTQPTPPAAPAPAEEKKLVAKAVRIPTFELSPVFERAAGKAVTVRPGQASAVRLRLPLEQDEWETYSATLETVEGRAVWSRQGLKATGKALLVQVPANAIPSGDYILRIRGKSANQPEESVADYSFAVRP